MRIGHLQHFQSDELTISQDFLEEMGKELVSLCDGTERYGLVDYQLGVWEEQIITGINLLDCHFFHTLIVNSTYSMSRPSQ